MNLVFVVLDTVRKDKISVYNDEVEFTETLEEFSQDSKVFRNAVSQAPWTLPSHASMFTGLYPWEHEATQKQLYLDVEEDTLAERFKEKGYSTACFTSNTWISPYTGMTEGFESVGNSLGILPDKLRTGKIQKAWQYLNKGRKRFIMDKLMDIGEFFHWNSENTSNTPGLIEKSRKFVEKQEEDEFFLFVNFMDAHMPHNPPEEYMERHAEGIDPDKVCQRAPHHNSGQVEADFDEAEALYDADMDYLDDQLEQFFNIFEEEGLEEDTVFVVVSDHGENLGENGMYGHQFSVSEKLVSVPLMIKAPGEEPEEIEEQFELRQLYEVLPELVFEENFRPREMEYALGGYEFPKLDLRNIPDEKLEHFSKKLRFIRNSTENKKIVLTGKEKTMYDLETGKEIEIDELYSEKVENIEEASEGRMLEDQDERVKKRLEDLGYI